MPRRKTGVRRSAAEWSRHVAGWRSSGLSAQDYADSQGLKASTLSWWAWKLRRDGERRPRPLELMQVTITDAPEMPVAGRDDGWELVMTSGNRLRGSGALRPELARALVMALVTRR